MSDRLEVAVDKIADKRKLPREMKQDIKLKIFKNSLVAIIYMFVLIVINVLYIIATKSTFIGVTKTISVISILGVVILFELAYKKDSNSLIINGIEALVLSVFIMFIPYIFVLISNDDRAILMFAPVAFAVYFIVKSIISYSRLHRQYLSSLSDVKEILKDDKKSYLDEDSKKIIKEKKKAARKGGK